VGEHQSQQAQLASALRIAVMRLSRRLRNETTDEKLTLTQLVRGGKKTVKTIVVT
jgi:predicted DNA-binding ribbon-helix-helix protein